LSLPKEIETGMKEAIDCLTRLLSCALVEADTHRAVVISGWNENQLTRQAIAKYLVGLRACAIDAALHIHAELENTKADELELIHNVETIVGERNDSLTVDQRQDERNPWIAEGMWHLCMTIAAQRVELHPIGHIIALDYSHVAAKDHGLDVLAIYESEEILGMTLIECKAYKHDPNRAISKAVDFFKEIDRGEHDLRIRQSVQIMRTSLPVMYQSKISGSFWKRKRSYVPNPHYDSNCEMDWSNARPSFRDLNLGKSNIVVMPHAVCDFDSFFDAIADEMRSFVKGL
jgi:hypothetical protein